jgi:hypothetical protein
MRARDSSSHDGLEMVGDNFLLGILIGYPSMIVLHPMNVVFTPPGIHPHVEELRVGIPFFNIINASTLLPPSPLHNGKCNHFSL